MQNTKFEESPNPLFPELIRDSKLKIKAQTE